MAEDRSGRGADGDAVEWEVQWTHSLEARFESIQWLNPRMDELHWDDRLQPWSAHPGIPKNIRSVLDSFPIFANGQACPRQLRGLLNNGKYKAHVWKVTVIFSITGAVLSTEWFAKHAARLWHH